MAVVNNAAVHMGMRMSGVCLSASPPGDPDVCPSWGSPRLELGSCLCSGTWLRGAVHPAAPPILAGVVAVAIYIWFLLQRSMFRAFLLRLISEEISLD